MKTEEVAGRLAGGETLVGTLVFEARTDGIGAIVSNAGVDFVLYDMEHTGWSWETIAALLKGAEHRSMLKVVRVPSKEAFCFTRARALGSDGVMAPMVESEGEARDLAQWCSQGSSDYLGGQSAARGGRMFLIAQIETWTGVESVGAIAAVPGVDVLWVGHNDLTVSMGIAGQFGHPRFVDALGAIVEAGRKEGKAVGILAGTSEEGQRRVREGFRMVGVARDIQGYSGTLRSDLLAVADAAGRVT